MTLPVYLDNHATTRVDPRVLDVMLPFFAEDYGNASSRQHQFGWRAEAALERARRQVASLVASDTNDVYFTSGATESINLALKGIDASLGAGHLITAATEHSAGLETTAWLERHGWSVTVLPVDRHGRVSPTDFAAAMTSQTIAASVMLANNEIGTIAPIAELGALCAANGILFHVDAAQAAGKITIDLRTMHINLLSLSAHKLYGPKGVGALVISGGQKRVRVEPLMHGGGHERGMRSGTVNVPGAVGFGAACDIARAEMAEESIRVGTLRDHLVSALADNLEGVTVNGDPVHRLPGNANITFADTDADRLMMAMKEIAVSTGSACSTAEAHPSHVLRAIGLAPEAVKATIRFGLGRFTTAEEIDYTVGRVTEVVRQYRDGRGRRARFHTTYHEGGEE